MPINNMFSKFGTGGTGSGWNISDMKQPTKEEKFPGLTAQQIKNIENYTSDPQEQQKLYQAMIQKVEADKFNDNRTAVENERFRACLTKTDPRERKFDESCGRQSTLVDLVKKARNLKANTPEETVLNMFMEEMQVKGIDMELLNNYLDNGDESILYKAGLKEKPSRKGKQIATSIGVGAGVLGAIDAGLYGAGALSEQVGKKIYDLPIDSSIQEARQVQKAGVAVKDAEEAVKDAKADLKAAKKTGEGIEEATEALETAQKELKTAKGKNIVKVSDTAREYNVGEGILEGWSAESRGIQAKSKANQIFKKTIAPALEKSKATINVQELIDSLADDIEKLAKNDPDKLNAYNEALESLKDSYKDSKFANYSLKDSQTLKSGLQERTPQKFWKGKEVTNEIQELKGKLSSKLTNAVHKQLSNELGESSAKLYKDYSNLTEYAENMAKQSTNAGLKQGFGNFWSSAYHKLTDGASAKVGLALNKGGRAVKKATGIDKVVDSVGDAWNYVVKNGKKFLKASKGGGLRVEDPVGMVQLLKLAPGTIGEIANEIGETSPAVVVDDLLFEVQSFKDEWNDMTDEERIQNIKDQFKQAYGSELNDESAIATYEKRKEKHPKGKYGFRDPVNDIELVIYT